MSQLTAVTAVCTLKWLLLCSFCILLFLWESRVVLELRPLCWKNDGFFHCWQLEFHACRMKHIDGNWRSYELSELRWWLLLDDRSERHCWKLKVVMFWDLSVIMEAKHLTKTHMVSVWMCPFGMFESDACSNPLVPCGVCLHAHRGCFDCWSWNQVFLMFFVVAVASAIRHLPPVKGFIVP